MTVLTRQSAVLASALNVGQATTRPSAHSTGPAIHQEVASQLTGGRSKRICSHVCTGGASGVSVISSRAMPAVSSTAGW